ncbi:MAG: RNA pseudouridine synthase [Bacteroidetes bacterium GWE2_29_8]|nr:MAG: RNA pseudouridine synthase [Bacteroidetes bacterium GWE2_29_8]OFY18352.1 MAG: RNA pseudouridine synthase [Bacteroidetes bacterium GWF2_29_10]
MQKLNNSKEDNYIDYEEDNSEEVELFENFRFIIDKGQKPIRLDKYLMMHIVNTSRSKIQAATEAGNVLVNDKSSKSSYKVKPLDNICVLLAHPPRELEMKGEDIPLDIIYEDTDIILINKPAGLVVHPGFGNFTGTLVNALIYYFENSDNKEAFPYLVHRIDKNTSGILIVAKTELAQAKLAKDFFHHNIDRTYYALVWGNFDSDTGTIIGNIARHPKERKVMHVFDPIENIGKHAITHYWVEERFNYITLLRCKLETGRTHQIRAHMKHIGHPIFNDESYGGSSILRGTTFSKYKQFVENCFKTCPRHALHAKSLGFKHPRTNEDMLFESDYPEDMGSLLEKWRVYTSNVY